MTDKPKTQKPQTQSERNAMVAHGMGKASGTARPRVRKIRHSPVTDRKKIEAARVSVQKLRAKKLQQAQLTDGPEQGADSLDDLEVPYSYSEVIHQAGDGSPFQLPSVSGPRL